MDKWQEPETIFIWIVVTLLFLAVLITFIVFLTKTMLEKQAKARLAVEEAKLNHQKELLEVSIKTQEKERKRVAADIHDALIGKLTVLKIQQEMSDPSVSPQQTVDLLNETINTARRISHDLSPPLLEFTPLHEFIEDLLASWKKKFTVSFLSDIRSDFSHNNEVKIQFTRILQELMTNAHKHSQAKNIDIHFRLTNQWTIIKLSDNGVGYVIDQQKKGLGLKNIETRVQYLRGYYTVKSRKGWGTSFLFMFPNNS